MKNMTTIMTRLHQPIVRLWAMIFYWMDPYLSAVISKYKSFHNLIFVLTKHWGWELKFEIFKVIFHQIYLTLVKNVGNYIYDLISDLWIIESLL